jgi:chromosome segregation ATPase
LVTRTPRTLGERELHGIEAPVHEIGRLIETLRQRALKREHTPPMPASVPTIGVGASGGIASALPAGVVPSADTASLAAEIACVERERDRVAAELETLRRDAQGKTEAHAVALERLRTQLGEADARAGHEQRAREELEARLAAGIQTGRDELRKALEAAREAERAHAAVLAEVAELRIHLERERQLRTWREPLGGDRIAEVDALDARLTAASAEADRLRETQAMISAERDRLAAELECMVAARTHLDETSKVALEEATTHLHDARTQAWDVAARLVETEAALDASREELTVVRAISVDAARFNARAMARRRVSNLRVVVRDLEACANVIDGIPLTGADPLREAAARFADIASTIDAEYERADP